MKYRIIATFACLLFGAGLYAQGIHTIDFKAGPAFNSFRYEGGASTEHGTASGFNLAVRYSYFFDGQIGMYAQLGIDKVYASEAVYFGTANKADGEKYMYRYSSSSEYSKMLEPMLTVGAAYQLYLGSLNIVPRFGAGLAVLDCSGLDYERRARDGQTGPEYFLISTLKGEKKIDYLIDSPTYSRSSIAPVFSSSLQFAYSFGSDVSLFIEPGIDWTPTSLRFEKTVTQSAKQYDPSNWAEAVAYSSANDQWKIDPESRKTENVRVRTAPFFSVDFGIRINL